MDISFTQIITWIGYISSALSVLTLLIQLLQNMFQ